MLIVSKCKGAIVRTTKANSKDSAQLLDDVSDDEINQGHGPALTNAIDHVNGEAPLRALVPNPAQQDADVVAAGQAGSFATPSVRMTSTSTSHELTLDNAHFGGRVPPCREKRIN